MNKIKVGKNNINDFKDILDENDINYKLMNYRFIDFDIEKYFWNFVEEPSFDKSFKDGKFFQIKREDKKKLEQKGILNRASEYPPTNIPRVVVDRKFNRLGNIFPVCILSLGRYEKKLTYDYMVSIGVKNLLIFVEPSEYELYLQHGVSQEHLVKCPDDFHLQNQGGRLVRNYIHRYIREREYEKYWLFDDNIDGMYYFYNNLHYKIDTPIGLRIMEDYTSQFDNLYLSGFSYKNMTPARECRNFITYNNKIYSGMLIKTDIDTILGDDFWRLKYNEDVDLTLQLLTKGFPTLNFNIILIDKMTTNTMKGGNTTTIYDNGKKMTDKFNCLNDKWKHLTDDKGNNIVKLTTKKYTDGRDHHHVNWRYFKDIRLNRETEYNIHEYKFI